MVTTAPRTEIGSVDSLPGWGAFSTVTQDLTEPTAWAGQQRVATVNRMRVDAQIDALCSSLVIPIMRMSWQLNPNGARDEIVEQISTDLGLPIKGSNESAKRSRRRFKHRDHLEHSLLALWYGHMFFEQVPDTENFDLATDGWRLRKLAPRMPASIDRIHTARDGGLAGISQIGWAGNLAPKRRGLTLVGTHEVPQIGVNALAAYVWKREGSNWSGRSMLRPLYRDWVLKDRALRVDSVKNERFGMGIPTATAPVGGDPTQYAKLAQSIRASEFGGVGLEAGASVGVEGIRGTLPDIMASIRYYDESMARSFMAMVVQLGQTQTGSRALGETFADFFQMLVEAVANWYADTTNEHVIEDLVDWNFGEDEQAPLLEWSYPVGEQTLAISEMVSMVQAGVITMDRETQQAMRQRTRLPLLPEEGDVEESATAATSPFASVGLPALVQANIISADEARDLLGMTGSAPTPSQMEAFLSSKGLTRGEIAAASKTMAAGGSPPFGHRQPNKFELAAGTDFDKLQQNWLDSTEDLVADWRSRVQASQIDELVEQVRSAVEANDLVALSKIDASVGGVELLTERLLELAEDAIVGAKAEALRQGVQIGTINTANTVEPLLVQRAEATANLLAKGISDSASRKAMNLGVALPSDEVADAVREHLEGLTDAYLQDMLGGAMTQAQNTGRKAVMSERPSRIYASELLDANTCSVCSSIDGQEFASLAAAEEEYPTGGHKGCLGGPRCRGTLVAVYVEGDDVPPPEPEPAPEPEPEPDPTGIGEIPGGYGGTLAGESGKASNRWVDLRNGKDNSITRTDLDDRTTRFDYKDGSLTVTKLEEKSYRVEWDDKKFSPDPLGNEVTTELLPTREELRAIHYYQGGMSGDFNQFLRAGTQRATTDLDHLQDQIDALDSVMEKSFTTQDLVAYRGGRFPDISVGDTFVDRGFASTSTDTTVAARFTKNGNGNRLMEIRIPEGTPSVYLAKRKAGVSEAELLLKRDTEFRVVSVTDDRVVLEVVNG